MGGELARYWRALLVQEGAICVSFPLNTSHEINEICPGVIDFIQ
jgi:hypothetical protein